MSTQSCALHTHKSTQTVLRNPSDARAKAHTQIAHARTSMSTSTSTLTKADRLKHSAAHSRICTQIHASMQMQTYKQTDSRTYLLALLKGPKKLQCKRRRNLMREMPPGKAEKCKYVCDRSTEDKAQDQVECTETGSTKCTRQG